MENPPKQYLYHEVPDDIRLDEEKRKILHPLNILKEKFPDLYEVKAEKYNSNDKRKTIPEQLIPTLQNATWGDVMHLTAIHPKDLKQALVDAGFTPKERKFYQIDPELLDPKNTTVYIYRANEEKEGGENYVAYNPKKLSEHAIITENTKKHYKEKFEQKEQYYLFVGIPHILHKGSIDVSNFPVITAEMTSGDSSS